MSLDITLYQREAEEVVCPHCNGTGKTTESLDAVYDANITHNLGEMASEAGIYKCLWRAPENGFKTAGQLVEPLTKGIELLERDPQRFKKFDAENGWGTYEDFLPWLKRLLKACQNNSDAVIHTSR